MDLKKNAKEIVHSINEFITIENGGSQGAYGLDINDILTTKDSGLEAKEVELRLTGRNSFGDDKNHTLFSHKRVYSHDEIRKLTLANHNFENDTDEMYLKLLTDLILLGAHCRLEEIKKQLDK